MPAVVIQPFETDEASETNQLKLSTSNLFIGNSDEANELSIEIPNVNDTFAKGTTGQLEI